MYTQCPECATVFRVTADALRVAGGTVRCGICSSSFNAIEYLNEQPIPRQSDEQNFEDTITVEEVHGTEFIELSAAPTADVPERQEEDGETDADAAGEDADLDRARDIDLEFHGSAQDLERLFVTAEPGPVWPLPAATSSADPPPGADDVDLEQEIGRIAEGEFGGMEVIEERYPEDLAHTDTHPGRIAAVLAFPPTETRLAEDSDEAPLQVSEAAAEDMPGPDTGATTDEGEGVSDPDRTDEYALLVLEGRDLEPAASGEDGEPGVAGAETAAATDEPGAVGEEVTLTADEPDAVQAEAAAAAEEPGGPARTARTPPGATPGGMPEAESASAAPAAADETLLLLIPDELRRDRNAGAANVFEPSAETGHAPRRWGWFVAAALLLLVLAAQAVHFWRNDLARNPDLGPWLMRAYAALGIPLAPPVDLSAFELRQLGAASDGLQAGRIKLRASIVNHANFAQPLPLLRLSLQDRFGTTIGTRDLEPAEYLPGPGAPPSGLLGPSQRADAEVVFVDPGRDAVGFELDVCLRQAGTVRCSTAGAAGK